MSCARSNRACSSCRSPPLPHSQPREWHALGRGTQRIRLSEPNRSGSRAFLRLILTSIGLHQRDNARLLKTLFRLRDLGNSVIVVEKRRGDHPGGLSYSRSRPGAGPRAARSFAEGTLADVLQAKKFAHGGLPSGRARIEFPSAVSPEIVGAKLEGWITLRAHREQPQERDRRFSTWLLDLRDRRFGQRKIHPDRRHLTARGFFFPALLQCKRETRRAHCWMGSSNSTKRS